MKENENSIRTAKIACASAHGHVKFYCNSQEIVEKGIASLSLVQIMIKKHSIDSRLKKIKHALIFVRYVC